MTVSVHKTGDIDEKSEIFFISIHLSMLSDSEVKSNCRPQLHHAVL